MLEKIFGKPKKKPEEEAEPSVYFGRYSDNNKAVAKIDKWNEAEALFKAKKYYKSIAAFFDYLKDDETENVQHVQEGNKGTFLFYQGSKVIRGFYDEEKLEAETYLATMLQPSVPVMRRLLEMNFNLYYSRYALKDDKISMLLNSDIETANPSKLYYGLKELATKADKQDDLLVQDFTSLQPSGTDHIIAIPDFRKGDQIQFFKKMDKRNTCTY